MILKNNGYFCLLEIVIIMIKNSHLISLEVSEVWFIKNAPKFINQSLKIRAYALYIIITPFKYFVFTILHSNDVLVQMNNNNNKLKNWKIIQLCSNIMLHYIVVCRLFRSLHMEIIRGNCLN